MSASVSDTYGLAHLPECDYERQDYRGNDNRVCYCSRLRACEQRVLTLRLDDLNVKSFNAGIDSAEAAVSACGNGKGYIYSDTMTGVEWALDAIRALKEDK